VHRILPLALNVATIPADDPLACAWLSTKAIAPVQPFDIFQEEGDAIAQRRQYCLRAAVADGSHQLFSRQRQRLSQFCYLG
jgi:hypothetical protein